MVRWPARWIVPPLSRIEMAVGRFGQAGDIPDLYRTYRIDADAILDAAAEASLRRLAVAVRAAAE